MSGQERALGPDGLVFVGTRSEGKVYALVDGKHEGRASRVVTIAQGLENPNGVAFRDGALYVAERSRVLRYDDIARRLDAPLAPVVVRDDYPTKAHHGWKLIAFGPTAGCTSPWARPVTSASRAIRSSRP
jgi:glucose/arabinose dehydrogenase